MFMCRSAQFLVSGIAQIKEVVLRPGTDQFQLGASVAGIDQFRNDGIDQDPVLELLNSMVGSQAWNCSIPDARKCAGMKFRIDQLPIQSS